MACFRNKIKSVWNKKNHSFRPKFTHSSQDSTMNTQDESTFYAFFQILLWITAFRFCFVSKYQIAPPICQYLIGTSIEKKTNKLFFTFVYVTQSKSLQQKQQTLVSIKLKLFSPVFFQYGPHGYSTYPHSRCQEVPTSNVTLEEVTLRRNPALKVFKHIIPKIYFGSIKWHTLALYNHRNWKG